MEIMGMTRFRLWHISVLNARQVLPKYQRRRTATKSKVMIKKKFIVLLSLLHLLNYIHAQDSNQKDSCGSDSIPYSLYIDLNAQPTLSCQTPKCFGHGHEHQDINSNYQDYDISNELPKRRMKRHNERVADCASEFLEAVCTGNNEWTAGVMEVNNGTHVALQMQCCRYSGMNSAMPLKNIVLDAGARYVGGAVKDEEGQMVAFDVIKEIRKNVTEDNQVQYIINVYRMSCLPDPPESRNKVDPYVDKQVEYLTDRITRESSSYSKHAEDQHFPPSSEDDYEASSSDVQPRRRNYRRQNYRRNYAKNYGYRRRDLPSYYDRDYPRRKQSRPVYARRRYYRPIVEEYDDEYEDLEPVPVVRRPKYYYYKRAKPKIYDEDQLWPVAYVAKPKVRAYGDENTNYIEPISVQEEDTQTIYNQPIPQTLAPAPAIGQQQQGPVQQVQQQQPLQQPLQSQQQQLLPQNPSALSPPTQLQPYVAPQPQAQPQPPPPTLPSAPTANGCTNIGSGTGNAVANGVPTYGSDCGGGVGSICDLCGNNNNNGYGSNGYSSFGGNYGPNGGQPQVIQLPAAQPSYSAPSSYSGYSGYSPGSYGGGVAGLNSAFGSLQCFSGDMLVQTPVGPKRMDELELGDMVLSIEEALITYSPVVMFLHKKFDENATYKVFETEEGKSIKLTDYHLIYATNCGQDEKLRLTHAKDVKLGQCIYVVESEKQAGLKANKVVNIDEVHETGIYAPLTATGDIFVNNVLASCHSNMAAQTLQQTFFSWWRAIHGMVTKWFGSKYTDSSYITGDIPYGVEYLTTVLDIIVPKGLIG